MGRAQRLNETAQRARAKELPPKPSGRRPWFQIAREPQKVLAGAKAWFEFDKRRAQEKGTVVVAPLRKGKRKPTSHDLVILRGDDMTRDELLNDIKTEVERVVPDNDTLDADTFGDAETAVKEVLSTAEDNLDEDEDEEENTESADTTSESTK